MGLEWPHYTTRLRHTSQRTTLVYMLLYFLLKNPRTSCFDY